ncbi:exported protein of unknown function [Beijerinckiaceae bacterium RH AL1]|nr:hypothetical protein [Beijerinckiaceae bacterium]VVB46311.1 exported protein of unknown function [Beijerinckiaceae bacterium RH CH11]VVB46396.1 exported protein of unknown function [Beijerinckiaceae bacterium RH AL8]VVC55310.1 exported protein of unknown function [Beijerinckiaceae bacterium RH AL1]
MIRLPTAHFVLCVSLLILALAGPASAQGTDEQREACTPDALKLCSDTIPDVAKTTACMKAHEAALSPRCRAVFNEPATSAPAIAAADAKGKAVKAARRKHKERETETSEARDQPARPRHRRQTAREESLDAPTHLGAGGDRGTEDTDAAPGEPAGYAYGLDIRRFPPGEGPDELPPYGGDGYDGGPRDLPRGSGPGAWGGPRFAYDGPDGPGGPGPDRFGLDGPDGPPRYGRDRRDAEDGPPPRHGPHRAEAVIARLCDSGEIDPHTCAVTKRALRHGSRE